MSISSIFVACTPSPMTYALRMTAEAGASLLPTIRGLALWLACLCLLASGGCAEKTPPESPTQTEIVVDRNLSATDIDPAVYFRRDDPADPFREVYAKFREQRAKDMADPNKPPPIEPFTAAHLASEMPWSALASVLPFDRQGLPPAAVAQLEQAVRARLAFDHPDVKITQLMLGPGATLPSHAGGSPGFYHVIGGSGEITVEGQTQTATPGTTVKLNPYAR